MSGQTIQIILPFKFDGQFAFTIQKAEEAKNGDWIIDGYAVTQDIDFQDDQITAEAIEDAAKDLEKNSTVLLNHDQHQAIGRVLEARATRGGLHIRIRISKTEADIWEKIKDGTLNKFSIRGVVLEAVREFNAKLKRFINVIKRMTLNEVSLVAVPANPEARALNWFIAKGREAHMSENGLTPNPEVTPPGPDALTMPEGFEKEFGAVLQDICKAATKAANAELMTRVQKLLTSIKDALGADDKKALAAVQELKAILGRLTGAMPTYPYPQPATEAGEGGEGGAVADDKGNPPDPTPTALTAKDIEGIVQKALEAFVPAAVEGAVQKAVQTAMGEFGKVVVEKGFKKVGERMAELEVAAGINQGVRKSFVPGSGAGDDAPAGLRRGSAEIAGEPQDWFSKAAGEMVGRA